MATLWIGSIVLSIILTMIVASKFNLKRVPYLVLLNVILPFAGLVYALYVVHVIVPRLVKAQTGQEVESPLKPYIDHYTALAKQKFKELTDKDDDKKL